MSWGCQICPPAVPQSQSWTLVKFAVPLDDAQALAERANGAVGHHPPLLPRYAAGRSSEMKQARVLFEVSRNRGSQMPAPMVFGRPLVWVQFDRYCQVAPSTG